MKDSVEALHTLPPPTDPEAPDPTPQAAGKHGDEAAPVPHRQTSDTPPAVGPAAIQGAAVDRLGQANGKTEDEQHVAPAAQPPEGATLAPEAGEVGGSEAGCSPPLDSPEVWHSPASSPQLQDGGLPSTDVGTQPPNAPCTESEVRPSPPPQPANEPEICPAPSAQPEDSCESAELPQPGSGSTSSQSETGCSLSTKPVSCPSPERPQPVAGDSSKCLVSGEPVSTPSTDETEARLPPQEPVSITSTDEPEVECSVPDEPVCTPSTDEPEVGCSVPDEPVCTPSTNEPEVRSSNEPVTTPSTHEPEVGCSVPDEPVCTQPTDEPEPECSVPDEPVTTPSTDEPEVGCSVPDESVTAPPTDEPETECSVPDEPVCTPSTDEPEVRSSNEPVTTPSTYEPEVGCSVPDEPVCTPPTYEPETECSVPDEPVCTPSTDEPEVGCSVPDESVTAPSTDEPETECSVPDEPVCTPSTDEPEVRSSNEPVTTPSTDEPEVGCSVPDEPASDARSRSPPSTEPAAMESATESSGGVPDAASEPTAASDIDGRLAGASSPVRGVSVGPAAAQHNPGPSDPLPGAALPAEPAVKLVELVESINDSRQSVEPIDVAGSTTKPDDVAGPTIERPVVEQPVHIETVCQPVVSEPAAEEARPASPEPVVSVPREEPEDRRPSSPEQVVSKPCEEAGVGRSASPKPVISEPREEPEDTKPASPEPVVSEPREESRPASPRPVVSKPSEEPEDRRPASPTPVASEPKEKPEDRRPVSPQPIVSKPKEEPEDRKPASPEPVVSEPRDKSEDRRPASPKSAASGPSKQPENILAITGGGLGLAEFLRRRDASLGVGGDSLLVGGPAGPGLHPGENLLPPPHHGPDHGTRSAAQPRPGGSLPKDTAEADAHVDAVRPEEGPGTPGGLQPAHDAECRAAPGPLPSANTVPAPEPELMKRSELSGLCKELTQPVASSFIRDTTVTVQRVECSVTVKPGDADPPLPPSTSPAKAAPESVISNKVPESAPPTRPKSTPADTQPAVRTEKSVDLSPAVRQPVRNSAPVRRSSVHQLDVYPSPYEDKQGHSALNLSTAQTDVPLQLTKRTEEEAERPKIRLASKEKLYMPSVVALEETCKRMLPTGPTGPAQAAVQAAVKVAAVEKPKPAASKPVAAALPTTQAAVPAVPQSWIGKVPPSVLAGIPPTVLANMPPAVLQNIPPEVLGMIPPAFWTNMGNLQSNRQVPDLSPLQQLQQLQQAAAKTSTHKGVSQPAPRSKCDTSVRAKPQQQPQQQQRSLLKTNVSAALGKQPVKQQGHQLGLPQGLPQGMQQSVPQGLSQGLPQSLPLSHQQGHQQGQQQSLQQALQQGHQQQHQQGQQVTPSEERRLFSSLPKDTVVIPTYYVEPGRQSGGGTPSSQPMNLSSGHSQPPVLTKPQTTPSTVASKAPVQPVKRPTIPKSVAPPKSAAPAKGPGPAKGPVPPAGPAAGPAAGPTAGPSTNMLSLPPGLPGLPPGIDPSVLWGPLAPQFFPPQLMPQGFAMDPQQMALMAMAMGSPLAAGGQMNQMAAMMAMMPLDPQMLNQLAMLNAMRQNHMPGPAAKTPQSRRSQPASRGASPANSPKDAAQAQRGSSPAQRGPSPAQRGPSPAQRGPSPAQRGPSPAQRGPSPAQRGPSPAQKGPSPAQRGPSPAQRGPSPAQRGPSPAQRGPSPAQKGPSLSQTSSSSQHASSQHASSQHASSHHETSAPPSALSPLQRLAKQTSISITPAPVSLKIPVPPSRPAPPAPATSVPLAALAAQVRSEEAAKKFKQGSKIRNVVDGLRAKAELGGAPLNLAEMYGPQPSKGAPQPLQEIPSPVKKVIQVTDTLTIELEQNDGVRERERPPRPPMPGLLPCKLMEVPSVSVLDKSAVLQDKVASPVKIVPDSAPQEDTAAVCAQLLENLIVQVEELRNVQSTLKEQQPTPTAPAAAAPRRAKIKVTPTRAQMTGDAALRRPMGRPLPPPRPPATVATPPTPAVALPPATTATPIPPPVVSISPTVTISPAVTVTPIAVSATGARRSSVDMSVPCSLPLNKVSQMLDSCRRPSASDGDPPRPTIPPMLAAGGLEIVPMDIASSFPARTFGIEKPPIAAPSISLSANVSLTLTPRTAAPPVRKEPDNPVVSVTMEPPASDRPSVICQPALPVLPALYPKTEMLTVFPEVSYTDDAEGQDESLAMSEEEALGGAIPKGEVDIDEMFEAKHEPYPDEEVTVPVDSRFEPMLKRRVEVHTGPKGRVKTKPKASEAIPNMTIQVLPEIPVQVQAEAGPETNSEAVLAEETPSLTEAIVPAVTSSSEAPVDHPVDTVLQLEVENSLQDSSNSDTLFGDLSATAPAPNDELLNANDVEERQWDEYVIPVRSTRSGKPLEPIPGESGPTVRSSKKEKEGVKSKKPSTIPSKEIDTEDKLEKQIKKGVKKDALSSPRKAVGEVLLKQPQPELVEEGGRKTYVFTVETDHRTFGNKGERLFTCDICLGVYKRAFSLKRHYLRSHINYSYLTERDISNCGIVVGNKVPVQMQVDKNSVSESPPEFEDSASPEELVPEHIDKDEDIGGVYQCYTCNGTFHQKEELREHLSTHKQELSDTSGNALNDSDQAPTLEPAVTSEPSSIPDVAPILDPAPALLCQSLEAPVGGKQDTMSVSLSEENDLSSVSLNESGGEICPSCDKPFTQDEDSGAPVCKCPEKAEEESSVMCLFCEQVFQSVKLRHQHQGRAHQHLAKKKRKGKVRYPCQYCENNEPIHRNLTILFEHMCRSHADIYHGCVLCEERFSNKSSLVEHQRLLHSEQLSETVNASVTSDTNPPPTSCTENMEEHPLEKEAHQNEDTVETTSKSSEEYQFKCSICQKLLANEHNLNRHLRLTHDKKGKKKKRNVGINPSEDGHRERDDKIDPETLFYSRISNNIRENLLHHLDGKLDSQELFEREVQEAPLVPSSDATNPRAPASMAPSTSSAPQDSYREIMPAIKVKNINRRRSSDGYRTWEKYAFPKSYDGKGGMTNYLRDMSHVDIYTQVTMRQNMLRLGSKESSQSAIPSTSSGLTTRSYNLRSSHEENPMLDFPSVLNLTQSAAGIQCRRTASAATLEKSMLSVSHTPPETPKSDLERRPKPPKVPAADFQNASWRFGSLPMVNGCAELSGEWVRPKNYLCAACDARFTNLYDLEDHKWNFHPNVWCTHFEFDDAALIPFTAVGIKSPGDLYRRSIHSSGTIMSAPTVPATQQSDMTCTKCQHVSHTTAELHRHMLDCAGDTTWQLLMAAASPSSSGNRRNRKWRPFGSRRRRHQGRRGLKRNIPSTPNRPRSCNPKTRGGDADTIQRMIANLPAKRSTRRVIQFNNEEIKTRSQATMASVPFPVSQSALHKASRALVDRSKTASSSKPGHMPKARALRTQPNTGAASAATAAVAATIEPVSAVVQAEDEAGELSEVEAEEAAASSPATIKPPAPLEDASSTEVLPSNNSTSVKSSNESPGDRRTVRTTTILEAMKLAMMDTSPNSEDASERKKSLRSEKLSYEMQVQAMQLEDEEHAMMQTKTPPSSMKDIHLPPAPSLELTTVQFLARSMPPNYCAGCQRTFCNNSNRDRHLKVCPFLLQIAGEGIPKLRKELEYRNHPLNLNTLHGNPVEFSLRTLPNSEEKPKQTSGESSDSHIADKLLFGESNAEKKLSPVGKKNKDKKKQVVGIRKRVVSRENPEGGVVIKESFLVRVDSSSNETVEDKAKESCDESCDDSENLASATNSKLGKTTKQRKPRKSDHVEKFVIKPPEAATDVSVERPTVDSKLRKKSLKNSVKVNSSLEEDDIKKRSIRSAAQSSNDVVDEDDLPLKKLTRSRNSSPLKIPVMRVDRNFPVSSSDEKVPAPPSTSTDASPRNSRQATAKGNTPRKTAADALDDEAEYDTDEFEELLDKMEPDEIKKLDYLSQVLEGKDSDSSDDDLPLISKRRSTAENYSSEDDLPLKPKSTSSTTPADKPKADSSDEEVQSVSKKSGKKKSSGTPIKMLQEIATSMAESLSDLQSSLSKAKSKTKKTKPVEEEAPAPHIKVIVKVPKGRSSFTSTEQVEADVSPSRRRSLRSRDLDEIQQALETGEIKSGRRKAKEIDTDHESEIELPGKSTKKRSNVERSQSEPELKEKDLIGTEVNSVSKDDTQVTERPNKKRSKQSLEVTQEVDDTSMPEIQKTLDDSSNDVKRNTEAPRSKKRAKTPLAAPVPLPEPNPETVIELDPNLIGELTPRLSRKRFKELATTPVTVEGSKVILESDMSLKANKKKSKPKVCDTSGEPIQENQVSDGSSKVNKIKSKTLKNPLHVTDDKPLSEQTKSKGSSETLGTDLQKTIVKSLKRKSKGGSVTEEYLEESSSSSSSVSKGKRQKLDESSDLAENVTGIDSVEARGSRRSRQRGVENSSELSETESTTTSIDTESLSGSTKTKSQSSTDDHKNLTSTKVTKRKSKKMVKTPLDAEQHSQDDVKDADSSLDETQPSSKRLKKEEEEAVQRIEEGTTIRKSPVVQETKHDNVSEDVGQVTSEAAAVPAANVTHTPIAASPTPAEAPDTNTKQRKSSKGSNYYCWVCQRHYSTAFNLHKHFASAYHKTNVNSAAKEDDDKAKSPEKTENIDLPKLTKVGEQPQDSPKPTSEKVADASCQTSEEDVPTLMSPTEKTSENSSKSTEALPETDKSKESGSASPKPVEHSMCATAEPLVEKDKLVENNFMSDESKSSSLPQNHSSDNVDETLPEPRPAPTSHDGAQHISSSASQEESYNQPEHYNQPQCGQHHYDRDQYSHHYNQSEYHEAPQPQQHYGQPHHYAQQTEHYHASQQTLESHQPYDHLQQQQEVAGHQKLHQEAQQQLESNQNFEQQHQQSNQNFDHQQQQQSNQNFDQQQQQSNQSFGQQQLPSNAERPNQNYEQQQQQHPVSQEPNQTFDQQSHEQQPQQRQQHSQQSYDNSYNSGNWQSSDSAWGPWRIPDNVPTYPSEEASGGIGLGLGSILDSVNQVLSGDGGLSDPLPMYADYAASLNDLQHAIGANDEEMAVLRQLGEGSWRELIGPPPHGAAVEEADLLDLDNQKKAIERSTPGPSTSSESTSQTCRVSPFISYTRSSSKSRESSSSSASSSSSSSARPKGSLSTGPSLNELYEDKQMWCPLCHRRFLGLAAMKTHMANFHAQSSDGRKLERRSMALSTEGSSEPRLCCSVCKEMVTDEKALLRHNEEMHTPGREPRPQKTNSEGLRTQMSSALGGLLDRALKNYLSKSCGPNATNSVETDKSRLTLGILSKLALRHQSGTLTVPSGSGVSIGTIGGASGSTTDLLVGQLVAAKLGMRRSSGSMRRRASGASSPGSDGSFSCSMCQERFQFEGAMRKHMLHSHKRLSEHQEDSLSAPESRPESPMEMSMEPAVGLEGAFLCSVCGINFKTPIEVLEHQRLEHQLNRRISREEEAAEADDEELDAETAEKAEKWMENHTKLQSSPKGRHPLGKDVKNRKVAIAVESALLERTEEMRIKAEAALRELNQTRKPAKGTSKDAKWGVDAVKFTVTKEPPLVGVYGPTLENESRQINIPVVRKFPNNAPRFSFLSERKKVSLAKGCDDARSEKEEIDVYEFDDSTKGSSSKIPKGDEASEIAMAEGAPPEPAKKKRRPPKKDAQTKKASEKSKAPNAKEADSGEGVKPKPKPKRSSSKKSKIDASIQAVVSGGIAAPPSSDSSAVTDTKAKTDTKKKAVSTDTPQPPADPPSLQPEPNETSQLEQPFAQQPMQDAPRDPEPPPCLEGPPAPHDAKEQSEVGKSRSPRTKAPFKIGLSVITPEEHPLPTRKQRRASMHDVTDYSVFDFSSDESTDEELLINPDVPPPQRPQSRRASSSPPKKVTRVTELVEEDWTWLEEDSDDFEREVKQRSARRKRARRVKSESPKKQVLKYQN